MSPILYKLFQSLEKAKIPPNPFYDFDVTLTAKLDKDNMRKRRKNLNYEQRCKNPK